MQDLYKYIHYKVFLTHRGDHMQDSKAIVRSIDADYNPILQCDTNLILNTHVYGAILPGGYIEKYSASLIYDHLYSQMDEKGYRHTIIDDIVDHQNISSGIERCDAYVTSSRGHRKRKLATKGRWFLFN